MLYPENLLIDKLLLLNGFKTPFGLFVFSAEK